jgi:hypothetical protein
MAVMKISVPVQVPVQEYLYRGVPNIPLTTYSQLDLKTHRADNEVSILCRAIFTRYHA